MLAFVFRSLTRVLLLASLVLGTAKGTTFLTLQSTYLGDGWFQYKMDVANDPFFTEADITGLNITFTNQIDQSGDSTNWSYVGRNEPYSDWAFTNGYPSRPNSETFLIRSSETSYRLTSITNWEGAVVMMSLNLAGFYPGQGGTAWNGGYSVNVVGIASMPCLAPCNPDEADGSPTNFVYVLKLLPDVNVDHLIQSGGDIYGVDFDWDSQSTFLLQGSTDFNHWTDVAYLWSYPPETEWTADAPLNGYGQYFRLALVADGHVNDANLPPLGSHLALSPKTATKIATIPSTPSVAGCQFANGRMTVNLITQAGQTVQVQALDSHRVVKQTQTVTAQGTSATAAFDEAALPSPVFFKALAQ